jgi:plastocyanin
MRKLLTLTTAAIAALALAAGTAGAGAPTKSKPPVTLEGKVTNKGEKTVKKGKIEIEADTYYFKPTFPKAKLGSTVTVKLRNESKTQHTFTIDALGIDTTLDPNQKATVEVSLPTDGALPFHCRLHGPNGTEGDFGMQGAFFSKKGQPLSAGAATTPTTGAPAATTGGAPPTTGAAPATTTRSGGGGYGY